MRTPTSDSTGERVDETNQSVDFKCELRDDRLDIAYRIYRALCAQHPDHQITLCDGDGRILEKER